MSYTALSFTLLFVLGTMLVSVWQKLGLEKDIIVGTIRSAIHCLRSDMYCNLFLKLIR